MIHGSPAYTEHFANGLDILVQAPHPYPSGPVRFGPDAAQYALRFHRSLPDYRPTALHSLSDAAQAAQIRGIYVKDESSRFGLKAFKGLGGSYAMFRILCQRFGLDPAQTDFRDFLQPSCRERCAGLHFVTATDGNHGKGVSWAAGLFGCSATVYMPAGTVEARRLAIEAAGNACAEITSFNYDQTAAHAKLMAERNGWTLIQDTSWPDYEQIPEWIIDGYLTLAAEAADQLGELHPTHIFLQAGVGAMAGGVQEYFLNRYRDPAPLFVLVEPTEAACLYTSVRAGDSLAHSIEGNPETIMAGLNCGTPCGITWPLLRDTAAFFCACEDEVTRQGMRAYAHPLGKDPAVVSGESGAVTYGLLRQILADPGLRELFRLTRDSVVLLISTEGDTDPAGYRAVLQTISE